MNKLSKYSIPFSGLSEGVHDFDFRLDGLFFEEFGNEEMSEVDVVIDLTLTKEATFMELYFEVTGEFNTMCDRCLGDLAIPIEGERRMIAKIHEPTDDEDILALGPQDTELHLARVFYESVVLELPLKRAHEEEDCDPDVIDKLNTFTRSESEESDPRWDALKKLRGEN